MAKRSRGDMLTGGTRDVNPQILIGRVTESAANTFTQTTINIPVLRGNIGGNKYQVIELLKVFVYKSIGDGATGSSTEIQLSTSSKTATGINDPDIFLNVSNAVVITTSGLYYEKYPKVFDFTDNVGHGIIIATPQLFLGIKSVSETNAQTADIKVLYRFKNISVDEFVGLSIQMS